MQINACIFIEPMWPGEKSINFILDFEMSSWETNTIRAQLLLDLLLSNLEKKLAFWENVLIRFFYFPSPILLPDMAAKTQHFS